MPHLRQWYVCEEWKMDPIRESAQEDAKYTNMHLIFFISFCQSIRVSSSIKRKTNYKKVETAYKSCYTLSKMATVFFC